MFWNSRALETRSRTSSADILHQGSRVTLWEACSRAASVDCENDRELAELFEDVIPVHKVTELEAGR